MGRSVPLCEISSFWCSLHSLTTETNDPASKLSNCHFGMDGCVRAQSRLLPQLGQDPDEGRETWILRFLGRNGISSSCKESCAGSKAFHQTLLQQLDPQGYCWCCVSSCILLLARRCIFMYNLSQCLALFFGRGVWMCFGVWFRLWKTCFLMYGSSQPPSASPALVRASDSIRLYRGFLCLQYCVSSLSQVGWKSAAALSTWIPVEIQVYEHALTYCLPCCCGV